MNPSFSIIVPVYNSISTLERCVNSILSQDYSQFELILIDDGSTDGSSHLCDNLAINDNRIKVHHKENGGVSSARNLGLDLCKGDWILFADADDYVEPDWISSFLPFLSNKDYFFCQNAFVESQNGSSKLMSNCESGITNFSFYCSQGIWGYLWVKCFRADLIHKHKLRFNINLPVYEDELFVADYCQYLSGCYIIDKCCYHYFAPDNFDKKYYKPGTFSTLLYQYLEVRNHNNEFSIFIVDRLVTTSINLIKLKIEHLGPVAANLFTSLGADIKYVRGKKKIPLSLLSKCRHLSIWKILFWFYVKFVSFE